MAFKKTNEAVKRNSGKVGNIRYYVKAGNTYSRSASSDVSNPRTLSQMAVRCRLANIKAVWQVLSPYIEKCFESSNAAKSIYALFTGRNHYVTPIYLTKEQKLEGYAIIDEYCISEGSLPTIKYEMSSEGVLKSNIMVGNVEVSALNIGELSQLIIDNNPAFKKGDAITFFALKQVDFMGTPYVKCEPSQITLDPNDANPLPAAGFDMTVDGCLASDCSEVVGAYGWVHARKASKKVSTQYLAANDFELIEQYSSDDQLQAAAESYGEIQADAYIFGGDSTRPEGMYHLTVQSEDTSKGTVSGGGYYAEGDNATFSAYPKEGYLFDGWYRNGEKFSDKAFEDSFDMPATDVTVVAKFVEGVTHTVSLTAGEGGQVQINSGRPGPAAQATVAEGSSVVIKAIATSGYAFVKWSDNDTNATRAIANVNADITLSAEFEEIAGGPYDCDITKEVVGSAPISASQLVVKIDGLEVAAGETSTTKSLEAGNHTISIDAVSSGGSGDHLSIMIDGDEKASGEAQAGVSYTHNAVADFELSCSYVGGF